MNEQGRQWRTRQCWYQPSDQGPPSSVTAATLSSNFTFKPWQVHQVDLRKWINLFWNRWFKLDSGRLKGTSQKPFQVVDKPQVSSTCHLHHWCGTGWWSKVCLKILHYCAQIKRCEQLVLGGQTHTAASIYHSCSRKGWCSDLRVRASSPLHH